MVVQECVYTSDIWSIKPVNHDKKVGLVGTLDKERCVSRWQTHDFVPGGRLLEGVSVETSPVVKTHSCGT